MSTEPLYLAVEIGGTKQQLCVGNAGGSILSSRSVRLGDVTASEILSWLETNITEMLQETPCRAIGVGFGGPLETASGRVLSSLQVEGWLNFELRAWFEARFPVPVIIANDTFTGGLGELYAGAGRACDRLFYTNIGTGIGGGLYLDGRGYDGSGFGAPYLGNTLVPDWTSDLSGAFTRMELLCSGRSIARRLSTPGYVPAASLLAAMGPELTALELGEAVRQGDSFACTELDRITESFSIALVNLLAITGVTRIVIGGGVAKMGSILFDRIRACCSRLDFIANHDRYEIVPSTLMDQAVPVGALLLAARGTSVFM